LIGGRARRRDVARPDLDKGRIEQRSASGAVGGPGLRLRRRIQIAALDESPHGEEGVGALRHPAGDVERRVVARRPAGRRDRIAFGDAPEARLVAQRLQPAFRADFVDRPDQGAFRAVQRQGPGRRRQRAGERADQGGDHHHPRQDRPPRQPAHREAPAYSIDILGPWRAPPSTASRTCSAIAR
jgi:hypothetical protein